MLYINPGAVPRAGMFCPFRARDKNKWVATLSTPTGSDIPTQAGRPRATPWDKPNNKPKTLKGFNKIHYHARE